MDAKMLLLGILKTGYGLNGDFYINREGMFSWRKTTPSAGALYPIEVLVYLKREQNTFCIYKYVIEEGTFEYIDSKTNSDKNDFGLHMRDMSILFLSHPQKSISKYGMRGNIYSLIDTCHALSNTLFYANALGFDPLLISRFNKKMFLKNHSNLCNGLEPVAFLAMQSDVQLTKSDYMDSLNNFSTFNHFRYSIWEVMGNDGSYFKTKKNKKELINIRSIRKAIINRYSSNNFFDRKIEISVLEEVFKTPMSSFNLDYSICDSNKISPMFLLRNTSVPDGLYTYNPKKGVFECSQILKDPDSDIIKTFIRQDWVSNSNALVFFCCQEFSNSFSKDMYTECFINSALFAQYLYLSCSINGLGISSIGAFDEERLKQSFQLNKMQILYVVALGENQDIGHKFDKENVLLTDKK
ncbi:nitroreductase family protein [Flavobacterium sp. LAR06]|uniref:nitroreductase family protein n=1 Tax=Flavobacterium sp. LAR06 TaxID=3064897 RepID=UPI0035C0D192